MDKKKILELVEAAKREFPSYWRETALDWICDSFADMGSHYTRGQVITIVCRMAGINLGVHS